MICEREYTQFIAVQTVTSSIMMLFIYLFTCVFEYLNPAYDYLISSYLGSSHAFWNPNYGKQRKEDIFQGLVSCLIQQQEENYFIIKE